MCGDPGEAEHQEAESEDYSGSELRPRAGGQPPRAEDSKAGGGAPWEQREQRRGRGQHLHDRQQGEHEGAPPPSSQSAQGSGDVRCESG